MAVIVPRWEWRTFGQTFGEAEDKIKQFELGNFKRSEEQYILSQASNENIKFRDDLMDVKSLRQVNDDSLEQWYPTMKEKFPMDSEKLTVLFRDFFKAPLPDLKRGSYTYAQFLDELVQPCELLQVVDVYKERSIYVINMAIVEIAEVKFNGMPNRTVCIEHADPAVVMTTVRQLGLEGFENINYLRAMKSAVGMS